MMNSIILMGRFTKEPEVRKTKSDISYLRATLAVERDYTQGGERKTDFIPIVAWRHTAEFISQYFRKGSMIAVRGTLQIEPWTDEEGNNRSQTQVLVEQASFCGETKKE